VRITMVVDQMDVRPVSPSRSRTPDRADAAFVALDSASTGLSTLVQWLGQEGADAGFTMGSRSLRSLAGERRRGAHSFAAAAWAVSSRSAYSPSGSPR
jgi:hypothetical protein